MLDDLLILIGRFHPLIIHLPIGFIVLGILIELNSKKLKWSNDALKFIFFWATITGILSIVSGYLQYQNGGYLWQTVQNHFFAGILTVILSFSFYQKLIEKSFFKLLPRKLFTVGNSIVLLLAGHLGGNITHGEEHLTEPIKNLASFNKVQSKPIKYYKDYKEKPLFSSVIQPILDEKCVKCHNSKKSSGKLKMHNSNELIKGGRNGSIINFERPEMSEMYIRIHLPKDKKKHMPPKGGKQLTREEINLVSNWIKNGSSFKKSVEEFKLDENLINYFFMIEKPFYPTENVSMPNIESLEKVRAKNILINPISKNSNFFSVNTLNYSEFRDIDLSIMSSVRENIVNLDLSYSKITDSIFFNLKYYTNLTVLKLNNTNILGENIEELSQLKNLKRIYLVNTKFDAQNTEKLIRLKHLEKVYLFQEDRILETPLKSSKEFQEILDFGNYSLNNSKQNKES